MKTRCMFLIITGFVLLVFLGCAGAPAPLEEEGFIYGNFDNYLSPEAEDLVRTGIMYHDNGDYKKALDYYEEAMEFAPNHPVIYFEMGFSYISLGDNETALEMAEKGIAEAKMRNYDEIIPTLLDLKGSALDNLSRSEEAIAVYQQAIDEYGVSNTLLYYNLAVSYFRLEKREEAFDAVVNGLRLNPNHPSSNYLLGRICMDAGKKTQALYAYGYFLLLEPDTDRSEFAYSEILSMLSQNNTIEISDTGAFTAADLLVSLAFVLDEENAGLSNAEKTRAKLYYIYTALDEFNKSGEVERRIGDELWWDFYAPFFYRIAISGYFDTYCRYIAITTDPGASDWINNGRDEIEGFFNWLNE